MIEPDRIFADPRLAAVYDMVDGARDDLDLYVALAREVGARRVIDLGCGTGSLACRMAVLGIEVTAVDPAAASVAVAQGKSGADRVRWIIGAAADAPAIDADLAVMTGNVAQVFLDDLDWAAALAGARRSLRPDGWLAFEARDPARRAWEQWTAELTRRTYDEPGVGPFTTWTAVVEVDGPFVRFRHTYGFADGVELTSESTLRFRTRPEITTSLEAAGFRVHAIRDAPDRPGLEWIFFGQRSTQRDGPDAQSE